MEGCQKSCHLAMLQQRSKLGQPGGRLWRCVRVPRCLSRVFEDRVVALLREASELTY